MSRRWLFFAGLSSTMAPEALQGLVKRHGLVRSCRFIHDSTGRFLRCAYVEMATSDQAHIACLILDAEALAGHHSFRVMVSDPPSGNTEPSGIH